MFINDINRQFYIRFFIRRPHVTSRTVFPMSN